MNRKTKKVVSGALAGVMAVSMVTTALPAFASENEYVPQTSYATQLARQGESYTATYPGRAVKQGYTNVIKAVDTELDNVAFNGWTIQEAYKILPTVASFAKSLNSVDAYKAADPEIFAGFTVTGDVTVEALDAFFKDHPVVVKDEADFVAKLKNFVKALVCSDIVGVIGMLPAAAPMVGLKLKTLSSDIDTLLDAFGLKPSKNFYDVAFGKANKNNREKVIESYLFEILDKVLPGATGNVLEIFKHISFDENGAKLYKSLNSLLPQVKKVLSSKIITGVIDAQQLAPINQVIDEIMLHLSKIPTIGDGANKRYEIEGTFDYLVNTVLYDELVKDPTVNSILGQLKDAGVKLIGFEDRDTMAILFMPEINLENLQNAQSQEDIFNVLFHYIYRGLNTEMSKAFLVGNDGILPLLPMFMPETKPIVDYATYVTEHSEEESFCELHKLVTGKELLYGDMTPATPYEKHADFTAYNNAKDELVNKLDTVKYTDIALKNVVKALGELKYADEAVQEETKISAQEAVDAETAKFNDALTKLVEKEEALKYEVTYNSIVAKSKSLNSDAYNNDAINQFVKDEPVSKEFNILGKTYQGYTYDRAGTRILTNINENMYEYSVKVVNAATGDVIQEIAKQHYGDIVELSQNEACDWAESHIANKTSVASKRMLVQTNSNKCKVVVKGNTTVYVSAPKSENVYKVTFVDSLTNKEVAFGYAENGSFNVADASIPTRIGYVVKDYTVENATVDGEMITGINSDVVVKVNYAPEKAVKNYTITVKGYNDEVKETKNVKFNDLVTVTDLDAKAWVNANNEKEILAFGDTYKFYATQNMEVKPVKSVGQQASVSVSDSVGFTDSTMLVGTFALPSNFKFVSAGIVFDMNGTMDNPTLADVNKENGVYNFSVSSYDKATNQFVVEVKGNIENAKYCSYLTYTDLLGETHTMYSVVKTVK